MSKSVEERIVEMRFDNQQFEKGVQTTMGTLDKLKQSLRLDGATKGLEEPVFGTGSGRNHRIGEHHEFGGQCRKEACGIVHDGANPAGLCRVRTQNGCGADNHGKYRR